MYQLNKVSDITESQIEVELQELFTNITTMTTTCLKLPNSISTLTS